MWIGWHVIKELDDIILATLEYSEEVLIGILLSRNS